MIKLKEVRVNLKSLHILPAEVTRWLGWEARDTFDDTIDDVLGMDTKQNEQTALNLLLGRLAVPYVARELAATISIQSSKKNHFRVGIATGSTVYSMVDNFSLPANVNASKLELFPLVLGPVPETLYSAGFITQTLARKVGVEPKTISEINLVDGAIEVRFGETIRSLRRKEEKSRAAKGTKIANWLDWVITGIGAHEHGQCSELIKHVHNGKAPSNLVGDMCSRLFGPEGIEIRPSDSDAFVGITFEALEEMCDTDGKGKRVIAIAGGRAKYDAILHMLSPKSKRRFNVLVTDELTARKLLEDIKTAQAKKAHQSAGGR